jgi:predicted nucleic acid-binding protein
LVDTPAWSLALRQPLRHQTQEQALAAEILQELIADGQAEIIGPVRQELLCGFRDEVEFRQLRDRLRRFQDAPLDREDYEEAARIHNLCRAAGVSGSSVDFLICAVAGRRQWQILTLDKDFERYARHTSIRLVIPKTSAS